MLLIVGGSRDHNIERLAGAARARNLPHRVIHTDSNPVPSVHWDMAQSHITINGERFDADGTSMFIRFDVFGGDRTRTDALYDALKGWALAHPQVGLLNRNNESLEVSKPRALMLARLHGLRVPDTIITNDFARVTDGASRIAKPVGGGSYTTMFADAAADGRPVFAQHKLAYPELRLFRVGAHLFAFRVDSDTLDCRVDPGIKLTEVTPPRELAAPMFALADRLGLDYAAADFKTDPATGEFVFLEINSMPMFTGYDVTARGRVSDAMVIRLRTLVRNGAPAPAVLRP